MYGNHWTLQVASDEFGELDPEVEAPFGVGVTAGMQTSYRAQDSPCQKNYPTQMSMVEKP